MKKGYVLILTILLFALPAIGDDDAFVMDIVQELDETFVTGAYITEPAYSEGFFTESTPFNVPLRANLITGAATTDQQVQALEKEIAELQQRIVYLQARLRQIRNENSLTGAAFAINAERSPAFANQYVYQSSRWPVSYNGCYNKGKWYAHGECVDGIADRRCYNGRLFLDRFC